MNIKKLAAEVTLLPVVFDGGNMTKDMTTGSPVRLIIGFAIPMFLGMLFQQFYSMVDTLVVGRFLGVNPLAGVGSTTSLNFMVIGFCTGVCNVRRTGGTPSPEICDQQRVALYDIFRCDDFSSSGILQSHSDIDEHAKRNF